MFSCMTTRSQQITNLWPLWLISWQKIESHHLRMMVAHCNHLTKKYSCLLRYFNAFLLKDKCLKSSNISDIKSQNLNDSRLVLQLSLPNPLKPVVKSPTGDAPTTTGWSTSSLPTRVCVILEVLRYTFIQHDQYRDHWWPGKDRGQGSHSIYMVCQTNAGFNVKWDYAGQHLVMLFFMIARHFLSPTNLYTHCVVPTHLQKQTIKQ